MRTINNNPSAANRQDGLLVALGHLSQFLDEKEWSGLARDVREAARAIAHQDAELESLRAMRQRVEGLADAYEQIGRGLRAAELRLALKGDSNDDR